MNLAIPHLSLVILVGSSGSGKSTFARKHFLPSEILSSDSCRTLISDNENDQSVTKDAFDVLYFIVRKRMIYGKLTVIDATNVKAEHRRASIQLASAFSYVPVGIVFYLPKSVCLAHNRQRKDRIVEESVLLRQWEQMGSSMATLKDEGFGILYVLDSVEKIQAAKVERVSLRDRERAR